MMRSSERLFAKTDSTTTCAHGGLLFAGLMLLMFLSIPLANASINVYEFSDESKRMQFEQLIQELRCPKCQNQNIADSDAGVAKLLKDRVYKQVQQGKTTAEIRAHLVDRYGEFITYRPPLRRSTWLLWFGPVLGLLIVVLVLVFWLRRRPDKSATPTAADQQRIQEMLNKYRNL